MAAVVLLRWQGEQADTSASASRPASDLPSVLARALSEDARGGFDTLGASWRFEFPRDHGAHPRFRSESWYVGANLEDGQGQVVSLQLSLARVGLASAREVGRGSAWAVNDVYQGELDLLAQSQTTQGERTVRGALDLAGYEMDPVRVWIGNWSIQSGGEEDVWTLEAVHDEVRIALTLSPTKPAILPRATTGASSPFTGYAMTRFEVAGTLAHLHGSQAEDERELRGDGWFEHGFGELPLPGGPVALDRWRLQLVDGRELSINAIRRRDGSGRARIGAVLVEPNGEVAELDAMDVEIRPTEHWVNARGDRRYPIRWRVVTPALDLDVQAMVRDRESNGALRRWSGPVEVMDNKIDGQIIGRGFAETWGSPRT